MLTRSYFTMALLGAMSLATDDLKVITDEIEFKNKNYWSGPQLMVIADSEEDQQLYAGGKVAYEFKEVGEGDNKSEEIYVYQTLGVNLVNELDEDDNIIDAKLDEKAVIEVALCGVSQREDSKFYKCMAAKFDRDAQKTSCFYWMASQADGFEEPAISTGADLYDSLYFESYPNTDGFSVVAKYEIDHADNDKVTTSWATPESLTYGIVLSDTKADWNDKLQVTFYFTSSGAEDIEDFRTGSASNKGYQYLQYKESDDDSVNQLSDKAVVEQAAVEGTNGGDDSWLKEKNGAVGHLTMALASTLMLVSAVAF